MIPEIIEPDDEDARALHSFLDERIYEFNVGATGHADGRPLGGVIKDDSGNIIAAIDGHSWGGCCHILHLWVHESRRRQGLGRALLQAAEQEAVRRGCARMLLMTHSFQAPAFYERLGYARLAEIPDYPRGHAEYIYLKRLPG
jgi:ribosomal protein S18 acetylase RimI-like enzyme